MPFPVNWPATTVRPKRSRQAYTTRRILAGRKTWLMKNAPRPHSSGSRQLGQTANNERCCPGSCCGNGVPRRSLPMGLVVGANREHSDGGGHGRRCDGDLQTAQRRQCDEHGENPHADASSETVECVPAGGFTPRQLLKDAGGKTIPNPQAPEQWEPLSGVRKREKMPVGNPSASSISATSRPELAECKRALAFAAGVWRSSGSE